MLRLWFLFERKLLGKLCSIAWRLLSKFIAASAGRATASNAKTAAVASIQTFGESVNFNPHIHIVAADGCFLDDGAFSEAWAYDTKALGDAFSDAVFLLLQEKGLEEGRVEMMRSWSHSGFHVRFLLKQVSGHEDEGSLPKRRKGRGAACQKACLHQVGKAYCQGVCGRSPHLPQMQTPTHEAGFVGP